MKLVLVTTAGDPLGGVFAKAYREADGPSFELVIVLPEKRDKHRMFINSWQLVMLKLLTPTEIIKLKLAKLGIAQKTDHELGLTLGWSHAWNNHSAGIIHGPSINDENVFSKLNSLKPAVLVSVGASEIFKREILDIPTICALNVHNGLLPKYRGHFGTFWEISHREPWAYVCIHEMVDKVDSGKIVAWERIRAGDYRSFLDLLIEKKRRGGVLLAKLMQQICETSKLPAARPAGPMENITESYFGWPSLKEVFNLPKWKSRSE